MDPQELDFAAEVDRLGARGLTQDEIAAAVGLTKWQVRWRLMNSGFVWGKEIRVRAAYTREDAQQLRGRREREQSETLPLEAVA